MARRSRRVLFLAKDRVGYWGGYGTGSDLSTGLRNSISYVVQMLNQNGIEAKFQQLVDNNAIDKAIYDYKPTDVVLEAYWVLPAKLDQLFSLHPTVHWAVRNHSELAFLSMESQAMSWTQGYLARGVELMCNSPRTVSDMKAIARAYGFPRAAVTFAPNWYPLGPVPMLRPMTEPGCVHVGCFGAVRPLKSPLEQACASLRFAEAIGRKLVFHINGTRIEPAIASPILNNLEALFQHTPNATLVEHEWLERPEFLDVMRTMDYHLQCSFSETFNICTSDAVATGVFAITSPQVPWMRAQHTADPNDSEKICAKLLEAHRYRMYYDWSWLWQQWTDLAIYCENSRWNWIDRYA